MTRPVSRAALCGVLLASAFCAHAQTATDLQHAQERHQRQLAVCNSGKLPAPEREACVRDAGAALDRARGGPPANVTTRTPDRRATVVTPAGQPVPGATETVRSRRSTTVVPADAPAR
ncbi:hypothetical protein [Variovorax ginsengisoli]|uniref:Secreted protein n=1 Tax=Variovorax ginsengisoli TaxID=363844 RepID=A0ABT8S4U6_9BURK|nr:hypothetical protein [Variovorax ginsengisoli]MDN8614655.1 hypothetical protein [Variovorax ginsengisoli]MDO1533825.1 hypothetical protein [Variovorax ginsengisoli]